MRTLACTLVYLLLMFVWVLFGAQAVPSLDAPAPYTGTLVVSQDRTADRSLYIFTLRLGGGDSVTLMGDQDLALVKWLVAHDGQRVPITLGAR